MKIDDKTYVPLAWLIACVISISGGAVTIALSLANMNYRISRIEETLHLPPYNAFNVEPEASAKGLPNSGQRTGE